MQKIDRMIVRKMRDILRMYDSSSESFSEDDFASQIAQYRELKALRKIESLCGGKQISFHLYDKIN